MDVNTENVVIKNTKEPEFFSAVKNGFVFVENKSDLVDLEWSASSDAEAWHTFEHGKTYEFGFSVYIRMISKGEAKLVVTK